MRGPVWLGEDFMDWQEQRRIEYLQAQAVREEREAQARLEAQKRITESVKHLDTQRQERQRVAHERVKQQSVKDTPKSSPIEDDFYTAFCQTYPTVRLRRQLKIGRYRVDFAHMETKTVIELDGYEYHYRKKDRNYDYQRQHEIEDMGWLFVRFTGSQIFNDVEGCVRHAYKRIMAR